MAEYLVNGYAYPSISEETLAWWLPRLTWLSAFSYGFTAQVNAASALRILCSPGTASCTRLSSCPS